MTGWTGHVAVLPAQATWHGHGKRRFVHPRTADMRRPSHKPSYTAMHADGNDDRFEAALDNSG